MKWRPLLYENVMANAILAKLYEDNAKELGVTLEGVTNFQGLGSASTDMGNVSHVVPSLHPTFFIGTSAVNHSRPFTDAAGKCQGSLIIITKP